MTTTEPPASAPADPTPHGGIPRPRSRAIVGATITIAGAAAVVVATLLPWFSIAGEDFDGFAEFVDGDSGTSGVTFVSLAVVVGAVGVITLVARRILPIALVGIAVAAAVILLGVQRRVDLQDAADRYDGVVELGPGTALVIAGGIAAALGSAVIVVVVGRRRR